MDRFDFRDYDVRVWTGDVFIHAPREFVYSGGRSGEGIQTNTIDEELNAKIIEACRRVKDELIKLNDLIDKSVEN